MPRSPTNLYNNFRLDFAGFSTFAINMAKKLDLNSTFRMNSGYEIPLLGYGVSGSLASKEIFQQPLLVISLLSMNKLSPVPDLIIFRSIKRKFCYP